MKLELTTLGRIQRDNTVGVADKLKTIRLLIPAQQPTRKPGAPRPELGGGWVWWVREDGNCGDRRDPDSMTAVTVAVEGG
jgi:hypothetical protein